MAHFLCVRRSLNTLPHCVPSPLYSVSLCRIESRTAGICFFFFMGLERFTNVVFSTFSFYYEVKLAVLCWLMFRQGADTIYRLLRRFIKDHRRRLAQPALAASRRLSYFPTTICKPCIKSAASSALRTSKSYQRRCVPRGFATG